MTVEWMKAFFGDKAGAELAENLHAAKGPEDRADALAKASRQDTRLSRVPRRAGLISTPNPRNPRRRQQPIQRTVGTVSR